MLNLEVIPEVSLRCDSWEFVLGMHFSQAIAIIKAQVFIIKDVQVLYSVVNPLGKDVIINLSRDGLRLIFDPITQRLKTIEVFNMKLVKLKYGGVYFNSPEVVPSIEQVEHSFGATHPGVYDAANQLFALHFRGLSFYFPVDSKFHSRYAHGMGSLIFMSGKSPIVSKMALYVGSKAAGKKAPPLPLSCYYRQLYLDSAKVLRSMLGCTKGLQLNLISKCPSEPRKQCFTEKVLFGDNCQDITTKLGAPNDIFYKCEDKMSIHSSFGHRLAQSKRSDIIFNYYTLGIDIQFDARTYTCKKFILHTNYPGHFDFNMYHRCEFQFQLKPERHLIGGNYLSPTNDSPDNHPITINAYSKWNAISSAMNYVEKPLVLHRPDCTNIEGNPFGSTFYYGYQDIIFEVMPNDFIASLTLYCIPQSKSTTTNNICKPYKHFNMKEIHLTLL